MHLKIGSVVVFVLGSPEMLIVGMDGAEITCKWFDMHGELQIDTFNSKELISTGQCFDLVHKK